MRDELLKRRQELINKGLMGKYLTFKERRTNGMESGAEEGKTTITVKIENRRLNSKGRKYVWSEEKNDIYKEGEQT